MLLADYRPKRAYKGACMISEDYILSIILFLRYTVRNTRSNTTQNWNNNKFMVNVNSGELYCSLL